MDCKVKLNEKYIIFFFELKGKCHNSEFVSYLCACDRKLETEEFNTVDVFLLPTILE